MSSGFFGQREKSPVRGTICALCIVQIAANFDLSNQTYPVAINQAYAATVWVAAHGNELNVDGSRLAVAGNSVDGNMAAVLALMAKDKKPNGNSTGSTFTSCAGRGQN